MAEGIYFPERRLEPRTAMRIAGTIQCRDGRPSIPCVIVDISRSGASIRSPGLCLPDEFVLSLNANNSVSRSCKVIWREALAVGVQFIANKKAEVGSA